MANEITTDKRGAMINSMKPKKEQLDSLGFKRHRALLAFELEVVSNKIDRFGWERMNNDLKDRLTLDWMDVLDPYGLDEVKAACASIMLSKPKDVTNEHQVRKAILKAREKALAVIPKQPAIAPNIEEPTAESKARVADMVKAFSNSHKMKTKPRTDQ